MLPRRAPGAVALALRAGCATESHQAVEICQPNAAFSAYTGPTSTLTEGRVDGRSADARSLFSDGLDGPGSQATTLLIGHPQETGRFDIVDREHRAQPAFESKLEGEQQARRPAHFARTGDGVEFGREELGDRQRFGILGSGRRRLAHAKVSINGVDVLSSDSVYSVQGSG